MKNRCKITVILFGLAFILNACGSKEDDNHHRTIGFINKSEMPIYVDCGISYPDTLFRWSGEALVSQPATYKVNSDTENRNALWLREFYEVIFRDGQRIPSDTLMVFVFDGKQLEANPSDMDGAVIQRYDLSFQDLKDVNWRLTYPPSPEMSGIKMYPPYKGQ